MNADKDILYRVAYDEAVRALSEQQGTIDSFRTRAGLVLSAAAITTSFMGAQALKGGGSHWTAWLALASFVGVAVVSLGILWPRQWEFTANPRDVIQTYIESEQPAPSMNCTGIYLFTCTTAIPRTGRDLSSSPRSFRLRAAC